MAADQDRAKARRAAQASRRRSMVDLDWKADAAEVQVSAASGGDPAELLSSLETSRQSSFASPNSEPGGSVEPPD